MPTLKNIRFKDTDAYGKKTFICDRIKEPNQFKKLKSFCDQLKGQFSDIFLPIFYNEEHGYATIRLDGKYQECVKNIKFRKNNTYDIKFQIRSGNTKSDKRYVSAVPVKITFKSEAKLQGELVDLQEHTDNSDEETT